MMEPHGILETALYAEDLDAAVRFYGEVIGLRLHAREPGRHVFFRCGAGMLLVFDPRSTAAGSHVPGHGATGPGHMAFTVHMSEIEAWRETLSAHGIAIEAQIDWPRGGRSIYVRDPAGNSVEFATPALWDIPEQAER